MFIVQLTCAELLLRLRWLLMVVVGIVVGWDGHRTVVILRRHLIRVVAARDGHVGQRRRQEGDVGVARGGWRISVVVVPDDERSVITSKNKEGDYLASKICIAYSVGDLCWKPPLTEGLLAKPGNCCCC